MKLVGIFLLIVFSIPIYVFLIWTYIDPEGSFFFGSRWMYREEPELSEGAIKYHKTMSIIFIVVVTITILFSIIR